MFCRKLALLSLALVALPVLAQTPSASPAHDPRIGQIIDSLEQVHSIQQTDLSPDGNLIAWSAGGIQVTLLNDPSHPKPVTACTAEVKGRESGFAWSPDSKTLAFFSNCTA